MKADNARSTVLSMKRATLLAVSTCLEERKRAPWPASGRYVG
jgi:hypothetical protein